MMEEAVSCDPKLPKCQGQGPLPRSHGRQISTDNDNNMGDNRNDKDDAENEKTPFSNLFQKDQIRKPRKLGVLRLA